MFFFNEAPIEYSTDNENFYLDVFLPGMKKENIEINYKNNILTIAGNRKEGEAKYSEITKGKVKRQLKIENIKFDEASANYKEGVLKIIMPFEEKIGKLLIS